MIKNYFLIKVFVKEYEKFNETDYSPLLLGYCLIVEDEILIKFLSEVVKEKNKFMEYLKKVLFKSRIRFNVENKD